MQRQARDVKAK